MTTTTTISDALVIIKDLHSVINNEDWQWTPHDERFATVVHGMTMIHELTKLYDTPHFTGDEVEFINDCIMQCNDEVNELIANENDQF